MSFDSISTFPENSLFVLLVSTKAYTQPEELMMSKSVFDTILKAMFGDSSQDCDGDCMSSDTTMPPWVLHVEDDAQFSDALKTRLESHGVAVIRAFDGADGVQNAIKYPANAIILDVEMPNGTGDEVLRLLKGNESTRHIPVIVLTCRKDRVFRSKMLDLGAAAYLDKPLDFSLLHKELSKHIHILTKAATAT